MHRTTLPRPTLPLALLTTLLSACGADPGATDHGSGDTTAAAATADAATSTTPTEATDAAGSTGSTDPSAGEDAAVTYYRDIKSVLDARCVQCHSPGNIAPFSLVDYAASKPFAQALADSADDGTMPPWPPDSSCRGYVHDRSLPQAERELLRVWAELGAPAGDPGDAPPAPDAPEAIEYDIELALPAPYTPTISPDEYRCFLIEWPKDEVTFVTGLDVIPGERQLVHHVIAYAIPPKDVDTYRALADADPDPGYVCYGGPGATAESSVGSIPWLGAWAPGTGGGAMPPGTGLRVAPGSLIALQMHYHSYPGAGPDQSRLRLRTAASVERPAVIMPFTDIDWVLGTKKMEIPAGDADVVQSAELDMTKYLGFLFPDGPFAGPGPFVVHAAGLHQHTLGTTSKLEVVRGAGGEECLLDIPRWDFDWQGTYQLTDTVQVNPGDRMRIECHWDNSAANQPIVDGVQQEPRDVGWGEGTGDEMCLGLLYVTAP